MLKELNDARGDLEKYVGQTLPSVGGTYTPPPREESRQIIIGTMNLFTY